MASRLEERPSAVLRLCQLAQVGWQLWELVQASGDKPPQAGA